VRPRTVSRLRLALGLLWFTSLVFVLGLVAATHLARAAGYETYAIRGASMEPAIPRGSLVVVARVEPRSIRTWDVVTVRAQSGVALTHRVVEVDDSEAIAWLHLKGDANETRDPVPVPVAAVVGRVEIAIPFAGYVVGALTVPAGLASVVAWFVALTLAGWLLEDPADGSRRNRYGHHAEPAAG
jgi:signal peptidase I